MNSVNNRLKLVNVRKKLSLNRKNLSYLQNRYHNYCETSGRKTDYCLINYYDKKDEILNEIERLENEKDVLLKERREIYLSLKKSNILDNSF